MGREQLRATIAARFLPAQFFNLTGNTSLVSLPALIKRAEWVIAERQRPDASRGGARRARARESSARRIRGLFGPYPLNAPTNVVVQAPVGDLKLLSAKKSFRASSGRARVRRRNV